jgi:hypothetical protein
MLRSLIKSLFPGLMHRIENESRSWMMQCRKCGHETSVWDYGGMRYGGLGPVYRLGRCRGCHKVSMLRVYQRDDSANR